MTSAFRDKKGWICAILVLLLCAVALAAKSPKTYGEATVKEITSIYDGDTFRCNLEGFPAIIGEHMPIRIAGIDTPELRDKDPKVKALARKAKQFTVWKLREAKTISLKKMLRGKYFRIVAEVYVDGENLGDLLIGEGLALPYDGGKKPNWTITEEAI